MTVNFWKAGDIKERRQKLIDYTVVWLMVGLTAAGVISSLAGSWKAIISAS